MTIKKKKQPSRLEIDLTGPQGNAFCLMSIACNLAKQLKIDKDLIIEDMESGDYEHLVDVFDKHFGNYVTLYR